MKKKQYPFYNNGGQAIVYIVSHKGHYCADCVKGLEDCISASYPIIDQTISICCADCLLPIK